MARHREIDRVDAERAQPADDVARRPGVDQGGLPAFAHEQRVPLPDVQEAKLETLGVESGDDAERAQREEDCAPGKCDGVV